MPLISADGRERRASRALGLINTLKSSPPGQIIFVSDEKNFVVDPVYNPQNDRYISFKDLDGTMGDAGDPGKYVGRSKHPAGAMFLGAVASTGETSPPIWFAEGFRLNADSYIKALKKTLIPWMRTVAEAHASSTGVPAPFLLQQDSAPAHRAKKTLEFLKEENVNFWSPQQWPANSPDLNPLDYAIWAIVAQGSCKTRPTSVPALK